MRRPHSAFAWAVAGLVLVVLTAAAACSGDDDETSTGTTATSDITTATTATASPDSDPAAEPGAAAPTSSASAGSATGSPRSAGCTSGASAAPSGAGTGEIVDVDGDGRHDTAWLAGRPDGTRQLGIQTASGGGDTVEISSASPVGLVVLAVDADEEPPVELLVSDNRSVQLWAFADCQIQQVIGPDGAPYLFDLGFRGTGTGVGCAGTRRGRDLVGLNVTDDNGSAVEWSRTVVELDGLRASHGETDTGTFRQPGDAEAIELLHTVSCGDLTIDRNGVRQPEP